MSQEADANLVELARKWLGKMMPYRRSEIGGFEDFKFELTHGVLM